MEMHNSMCVNNETPNARRQSANKLRIQRRKTVQKQRRRDEKLRKRARQRPKLVASLLGSQMTKRQLRQNVQDKIHEAFTSGVKVCIDCKFEPVMSIKECNKFAQQLCRAYGANRKATRPVSMHLINYSPSGSISNSCRQKCDGFDTYVLGKHKDGPFQIADGKKVIYLSPDASDPLLTISPECIYVIGGLVDEHLLKNATLNEAHACQIHAARLPLPEFCRSKNAEKPTKNPVLSINQVVELILCYLNNGNDWPNAIISTVPSRFLKQIPN